MTAVVTGVGLGLERSSANLIGPGGVLGTPAQGQGGDEVYVNAATGNLIDQRTDQILTGVGLNDVIADAYNSLGTYSSSLGASDGWMGDYQRSVGGLTGTVNNAGSTITRTAADGSQVVYTYQTTGAYANTYLGDEGSGAYDTLTYNTTSHQWTWTDGSSQLKEVYDGNSGGRIVSSADLNGNALTYAYTGALLTTVTTTDTGGHQDTTTLSYNGSNQLTSIVTSYWDIPSGTQKTLTQVYYSYDAQGRLSTITTDLSPTDNATSDGNTYVTTYGYQSTTSQLITSITQSDGSSLVIGYNGSNQVTSLTQTVASGVTRVTTFSYAAGVTTVTDPLGIVTTLTYDANGNLTQKAIDTAGLNQVTGFGYDANGDLTSVNNPDGTSVTYTYDGSGNRLSQVDSAGNTTTWTYGAQNQILSKTTYTTPAQGATPASGTQTTWYVYDANDNLTYTVDPNGDVTQYSYDAHGQQLSSVQYTNDTFPIGTLPSAPTASASSQTVAAGATTAIALSLAGGVASLISIGTGPTHGVLTIDGTSVFYTPNAGYTGSDSFTFSAKNAGGSSLSKTVALTVANEAPLPSLPVATSSSQSVMVGTSVDPIALSLSGGVASGLSITANPAHGTLTVSGTSVLYTPTAGYIGTDSFTYKATNAAGASSAATVSLTVMAQPQAPVASPSNQTVLANSANNVIALNLTGGLANVVSIVTQPANGTVSVSGTSVTYTPNAGFAGSDSFYYTASNATGATATTEVQLGVTVSALAVANAFSAVAASGAATTIYPSISGQPTSLAVTTGPAHGTVTVSGTHFTYTPNAGYTGPDSFQYTATNAAGTSAPATATINVASSSTHPVAAASTQIFETGTTNPLALNLSGGPATSITINSQPVLYNGVQSGSVTVSGTAVTFTPNGGMSPPYSVSFTYTASNGAGSSGPVTMTLQVMAGPAAPLAYGSAVNVVENSSNTQIPLNITGGATSVTVTSAPTHGTLTISGASVKYTPTAGYTGSDSFAYTATNPFGSSVSGSGSVAINVIAPPSGAPVLSYSYNQKVPVNGVNVPLQINNSGGAITGITVAVPPVNGTVNLVGGVITYTPDPGYTGSDSLKLSAFNSSGTSAQLSVALTVTQSYAPAAAPTSTVVAAGSTSNPVPLDISGAVSSIAITASPAHGTLSISGTSVSYTPTAGYTGADSFSYTATNSFGTSSAATATLNVYSVPPSLTANAVKTAVAAGSSANPVVLNITGQATSVAVATPPSHGTVTIIGTSVTYTPNAGYSGTDSFTYTATNANGTSPAGTATIVVNAAPVAAAPSVSAVSAAVTAGSSVNPIVLNINGQPTSVAVTSGPSHGTIAVNGTTISYTPTAGYTGSDSFTYTASNAGGTSAAATASLVVNSAPTITAPTLAQLNAWSAGLTDLQNSQRTDTTYDFRGNIATVTTYGADSSTGAGVGTPTTSTEVSQTTYVYDPAGRLVSSLPAAAASAYSYGGTQRLPTHTAATYAYDGLGRLLSATDLTGATTTYAYAASTNLAAANTVTITQANGLVTVNSYDRAGELVSSSETGPNLIPTPQVTNYKYDADGRLMFVTDPDGNNTYSLYNNLGQKTAEILPDGAITEYRYTSAGQVNETIQYATPLTGTQLSALASPTSDAHGNPTPTAVATVRPASNAADRYSWSVYDSAHRVIETIAGDGAVTTYAYDGTSQLLSTTLYAVHLLPATLASFQSAPPSTPIVPGPTPGVDQTTRYFYDADGNLVGTLDGDGFLTQTLYDDAGNKTQTITFANAAAQSLWAAGTFSQLLANVGSSTSDDHNWYVYDARGLLRGKVDGDGDVTQYHYDPMGNVDQTITGQQLSVSTLLSSPPTLSTLTSLSTTGTGIEVTNYTHDLNGNLLTKVQSPASGTTYTTTNVYDTVGNLVVSTDANGKTSHFVYDAEGNLIYAVDALGDVTQTTYDADGNVITVRRYASQVASATLTSWGTTQITAGQVTAAVSTSASDEVTNSVYDVDDRLKYSLDANLRVTEYDYDTAGNVVQTIDYAGSIASTSSYTQAYVAAQITSLGLASNTANRITRAVYDGADRLAYSIDAMGGVIAYSYDAAGDVTKTIELAALYTTTGIQSLATMQTWAAGVASVSDRVSITLYDGAGNAIYKVDPDGYVTAYTYNMLGQVTSQTRYAAPYIFGGDDPNYLMVKYFYQAAFGRLPDAGGWATYVSAIAGGMTPSGMAASLAASGEFLSDTSGLTTNTQIVDYFYRVGLGRQADPSGEATYVAYLNGGGTVAGLMQIFAQGSELQSNPMRASSLAAAIGSPSGSQVTTYAYDAAGRLIQVTDPLGVVTLNSYNAQGLLADRIQAYGSTDAADTHYVYDALGRVTAKTLAYGQAEASTTSYTYDGLGRVLTQTDGRSNTTTYTYDANGNVVTMTDPLSAVTTNVYDAFGNLVKTTDPKGAVGYFYYDLLNRQTLQIDPDGYATKTTYTIGNEVASVTRYHLPTTGAPTTTTPPSINTNAADELTSFTRDNLGRIKTETDANGYTQNYTYDAFGDQLTDQNQLGGTTTYTYNGRGLMTSEILPISSVTAAGTTEASSVTNTYAYDGFGNRITMVEASGLTEQRTTHYVYDLDNRLVQQTGDAITITNGNLTTTAGVTPTTTYVYDRRGNLIEKIDPDGDKTFSYYDRRGDKIAQVDALGALTTWTYDGNGNALTQTVYGDFLVGLPGSPGGTPPSPVNSSNYRQTTYAYDKDNRLTTTTVLSTSGANVILLGSYNGTSYTAGSAGTNIVTSSTYDADGNVTSTTDGNGNVTWFYYDKLGRKIAQVDPLGYVTTYQLDQDGNVVMEQQYAKAANVPGGITSSTTLATILADTSSTVANGSSGNIISVNLQAGPAASVIITTAAAHGTASVSGTTVTYTPTGTYAGTDSFGYTVTYANGSTYVGTASIVVNAAATAGNTTTSATLAAPIDRVTTFTYDKDGQRLTETRQQVAYASIASGAGAMTTGVGNATITYTYNGLGEVLTQRQATGDTTTYTYDGEGRQSSVATASYTDAAGGTDTPTTLNYYDGLGDLTRSTVGNAGAPVTSDHVTTYTYGAGGRLATMTDASGFVQTYGYDANGNTISDSYSRVQSNGSNVTEAKTDAYDALGRVVATSVADQVSGSWVFGDVTNVAYDSYGEITGKGVNGLYQQSFVYNGAGQVVASNAKTGALQLFMYDADGNQTLGLKSAGSGAVSLSGDSVATGLTLINGAGVTATYTQYDKDSNAIKTVLPYQQLTASTTANVTTSATYDAFGDQLTTTNALGGVTSYAFNTLGDQTALQEAAVNYTDQTGVIHTSYTPTSYTYYDLGSRQVATKDANGNLITELLLAGTGYNGSSAQEVEEFQPDAGQMNYGYDVFGDQTKVTDQLSRSMLQTFDAMGRLLTVTYPADTISGDAALVKFYAYDGLGQRIATTNSQFAPTLLTGGNTTANYASSKLIGSALVKSTTDYDDQGRVTSSMDYLGNATTYSYAWNSSQGATGFGTFGGWTETTNNTAGLAEVVSTDYFGHKVSEVDFGNHIYSYVYDAAGDLIQQYNNDVEGIFYSGFEYFPGQALTYVYFNTGRLHTITEAAYTTSYVTTYGYDAGGDKISEGYVSGGSTVYENEAVTYDALGRVVSIIDPGSANTLAINIGYEYDLNNNVVHMTSNYNTFANSTASEDYWYAYDSMNREVIDEGVLLTGSRGGGITEGFQGKAVAYDAAGERVSVTTATSIVGGYTAHSEFYVYSGDGYLANVSIATQTDSGNVTSAPATGTRTVIGQYTRDSLGRVTTEYDYTTSGPQGNGTETSSTVTTYDNDSNAVTSADNTIYSGYNETVTTHYYYGLSGVSGGAYQGGVVTEETTSATGTQSQPSTDTLTTYRWGDYAQQSTITYTPNTASPSTSYTTALYYNSSGYLVYSNIGDGAWHQLSYVENVNGEIMDRTDSAGPKLEYFYLGAQTVGSIDSAAGATGDYATSINQQYSTTHLSTGTNFDQNYSPITISSPGDASQTYTVVDGDTLQSIAQQIWGDSNLWYLIADANGLSPEQTLVAGTTLVIPNDVVNIGHSSTTAKPYNLTQATGYILPTAAPPPPPHHHSGCGVIGQILEAIVAIVVTIATAGALGPVAGIFAMPIAATVGDAAAQVFGLATGIQNKFNWDELGMTALDALLLPSPSFAPTTDLVSLAEDVGLGALHNAETQGLNMAVGLQSTFSWAGVAAAGIEAGVSAGVEGVLAKSFSASNIAHNQAPALTSGQRFMTAAVGQTAAALSGAGVRSLITGTDFGQSLQAELPNVIGQTIGNLIGGALTPSQSGSAQGAQGSTLDPTFETAAQRQAEVASQNALTTTWPTLTANSVGPMYDAAAGFAAAVGGVTLDGGSGTNASAAIVPQHGWSQATSLAPVLSNFDGNVYSINTEVAATDPSYNVLLGQSGGILSTGRPGGEITIVSSNNDPISISNMPDPINGAVIDYAVVDNMTNNYVIIPSNSAQTYFPSLGISFIMPSQSTSYLGGGDNSFAPIEEWSLENPDGIKSQSYGLVGASRYQGQLYVGPNISVDVEIPGFGNEVSAGGDPKLSLSPPSAISSSKYASTESQPNGYAPDLVATFEPPNNSFNGDGSRSIGFALSMQVNLTNFAQSIVNANYSNYVTNRNLTYYQRFYGGNAVPVR